MDINQLRAQLKQLGVKPPDVSKAAAHAQVKASFPKHYELRNSIYLQHLIDTQTFFTQTMALDPANNPDGLGNDYDFVKAAVTSTNLISELAETLDLFAAPAVEQARNQAHVNTFQAYFDNHILDPNYAANVAGFMNAFPITAHALQTITANFQQNILQACRRVIQDKAALQLLFNDEYPYLTLRGLSQIRSTGSDFHKGGKQVLILTFSAAYFRTYYPTLFGELKVVYKPSDIEADCLLVGNSAAARRADPNFPINASLTEIVNDLITAEQQNNPHTTLELLPTYRILPRDYISQQPHPTAYPLPVRNAYGYIEYLESGEFYGPGYYYYPLGASDFLIYYNQKEEPIIEKFYRQMGQLSAIACTLSLQDLHVQNVRARKYMPYLIDLEICLVKPVNDISLTQLLMTAIGAPAGGINGLTLDNEEFVWGVTQANQQEFIERVFPPKTFQNRLWALRPGKRVVPPNAFYLLEGFNNGMDVLRTCVQNNVNDHILDGWFNRMDGVLVRYTPYPTSVFKGIRKVIYEDTLLDDLTFGAQPGPTIIDALFTKVTTQYQAYAANPTPRPDFLVFQSAAVLANSITGPDYNNVDIPVFYHRVGDATLVDSQGRLVAVPNAVTIYGPNPPQTVQQNIAIGNTFFPQPPTANVVRAPQVNILNVPLAFNARVAHLQTSILNELGLGQVPQNPGVLIP